MKIDAGLMGSLTDVPALAKQLEHQGFDGLVTAELANDPFFRGYYEGSGRLLLNAVILGPGMGASQPNPW